MNSKQQRDNARINVLSMIEKYNASLPVAGSMEKRMVSLQLAMLVAISTQLEELLLAVKDGSSR